MTSTFEPTQQLLQLRQNEEFQRRGALVAQASVEMESRGDAFYAAQGLPPGRPAGGVERNPAPVPYTSCLVTGSEGMVGTRLISMLAKRGAKRVVCLDVVDGPSDAFKALAAKLRGENGVELTFVKADIAKAQELFKSGGDSPFAGVEVVFHLAALVGPFYKHELYDAVNNQGAMNVLEAFSRYGGSSAGKNAVLVDCSTPSTRYPLQGGWEGLMEKDMSYQDQIHEYATTKAKGEKAILAGNGSVGEKGCKIATCAVAPHQVYAPEDKLFLPSMLATAKSGKLRIFGSGDNRVSFTHADNIAHGLILAANKLWREGPESAAAGEFFIISDTGCQNFWDVVDMAVTQCGMPSLRSRTHLPPALLWCVAYVCAVFTKVTGRFVKLTPFTLRMLLINRSFCTAKARHILNYAPVVSFEDGWAETMNAVTPQFSN